MVKFSLSLSFYLGNAPHWKFNVFFFEILFSTAQHFHFIIRFLFFRVRLNFDAIRFISLNYWNLILPPTYRNIYIKNTDIFLKYSFFFVGSLLKIKISKKFVSCKQFRLLTKTAVFSQYHSPSVLFCDISQCEKCVPFLENLHLFYLKPYFLQINTAFNSNNAITIIYSRSFDWTQKCFNIILKSTFIELTFCANVG